MKEGQSPGRDLGMLWLHFWKEVIMNRKQCPRVAEAGDSLGHRNHRLSPVPCE